MFIQENYQENVEMLGCHRACDKSKRHCGHDNAFCSIGHPTCSLSKRHRGAYQRPMLLPSIKQKTILLHHKHPTMVSKHLTGMVLICTQILMNTKSQPYRHHPTVHPCLRHSWILFEYCHRVLQSRTDRLFPVKTNLQP